MSETDGVMMGGMGRHGELLVAQRVEPGHGFRLVTHNFCDPCSWWQGSSHLNLGSCMNSGNDMSYEVSAAAGGWIIDARHKRFTFEDKVVATTVSPNGSLMVDIVPTVSLNGVPLDQSLEDHDTDGDRYSLVYSSSDGPPSVVFGLPRNPSDVVTVSCRLATVSTYTFKPAVGMRLVFEDAEVDHTEDLDMTSAFMPRIYGSRSEFPPVGTAGTLVQLGGNTYNNVRDFHAVAKEFVGPFPAGVGGAGGVNSPLWTWKWGYSRADELYSSISFLDQSGFDEYTWNEIRCSIDGHIPYGGSYMTLTYYGQEKPEDED